MPSLTNTRPKNSIIRGHRPNRQPSAAINKNTSTAINKNKRTVFEGVIINNDPTNEDHSKDKDRPTNGHNMPNPHPVPSVWFDYVPELSTSHHDCYQPKVETNISHHEHIKRAACLQQFVHCCSFLLEHSLDTTFFKRYQCNVKVGCLHPDYFIHYFSQHRCRFERRTQILKFEKQTRLIECYAYVFEGFENMPGLGCEAKYASKSFISKRGYHDRNELIKYNGSYRMYFHDLVFVCNPETYLVTVDFQFYKEVKNEVTGEWSRV